MNQLEVQIMGQSYLLACPAGGEPQMLDAVERVDTAMCKIRDAGKVKARDRIAVLAALNLAFEVSDSGTPVRSNATVRDPAQIDDERLASLLQRLDTALGTDGRLI